VDGDAWMAHAWHHIALTFNGTASILYVDGEQRAAWYEHELKQVLPHAPKDPTQRSPTSALQWAVRRGGGGGDSSSGESVGNRSPFQQGFTAC